MFKIKKQLISEVDQIKLAQQNPKDFEPLYKKYFLQIYKFVYSRIGSESNAKEITSLAFTKALVNVGKYKDKGFPFSSWLYRIARNEINDFYRRNQKQKCSVVSTEELFHLKDEIDVHHDHSDERMQKLVVLLNSLEEDEIELIELKYFEKRPYKEIAEITGLSESNVRVKTHRIVQKLKTKNNG